MIVPPWTWLVMLLLAFTNCAAAMARGLSFVVAELPVLLQVERTTLSDEASAVLRSKAFCGRNAWRIRCVWLRVRVYVYVPRWLSC